MTTPLPSEFVASVTPLLGEELPAFLATYQQPATRGLRCNQAKIDRADLAELLGRDTAPVPWCPTGLRLLDEQLPGIGTSRAHRAGLCYLQEPSAMSPAEVLAHGLGADMSGARVVDLAAAPGGKATRLAELVGQTGLVVANDVERNRLGVLHQNLDRWGATNVVTLSRPVDQLVDAGAAAFDGVLLDAPCTGEGMFRRDPTAIGQWSPAAVRGSARRQAGLLAAAASLVRPGGVLVYSTCTFAPEENEERIAALCADGDRWEIEDARIDSSFAHGCRTDGVSTERTARLWPHRLAGEGHFVALLRRVDAKAEVRRNAVDALDPALRRRGRRRGERGGSARAPAAAGHSRSERASTQAWLEFVAEAIPAYDGAVHSIRERVYAEPPRPVPFRTDLLARSGTPLGRARPGRFEPAQALAGLLSAEQAALSVEWNAEDPNWQAYLRGEEIPSSGPDGWVLVTAHGWGLGWARRRGGVLKNFLPRALRTRG